MDRKFLITFFSSPVLSLLHLPPFLPSWKIFRVFQSVHFFLEHLPVFCGSRVLASWTYSVEDDVTCKHIDTQRTKLVKTFFQLIINLQDLESIIYDSKTSVSLMHISIAVNVNESALPNTLWKLFLNPNIRMMVCLLSYKNDNNKIYSFLW